MSVNFANMLKNFSMPVLMAMRHDLIKQHMNISMKTNVYEMQLSHAQFQRHQEDVQELENQIKKLDTEIKSRLSSEQKKKFRSFQL